LFNDFSNYLYKFGKHYPYIFIYMFNDYHKF